MPRIIGDLMQTGNGLRENMQFLGSFIGSLVAPIDDWDKVEEMLEADGQCGCPTPNCGCKEAMRDLFKGLAAIRTHARRQWAERARAKEAEEKRPVGRPAASGFTHVAGHYRAGLQYCLACGGLLCNDVDKMVVSGSQGSTGFEAGGLVEVSADGHCAGEVTEETRTLPHCDQ